MSALRGRVLGDEEAAKYWDQRGAEPGGQGVREGMFRDDPASRSTQRRGAPGRKAWVKPPPKPVVLDKTKELDAKRNFLALKVRCEPARAGFGGRGSCVRASAGLGLACLWRSGGEQACSTKGFGFCCEGSGDGDEGDGGGVASLFCFVASSLSFMHQGDSGSAAAWAWEYPVAHVGLKSDLQA